MGSFADFEVGTGKSGDLFDGGESLFRSETEIPLEVRCTIGTGFSTEDEVREDRFFSVGGDGFTKESKVEGVFINGVVESEAPIFCVRREHDGEL